MRERERDDRPADGPGPISTPDRQSGLRPCPRRSSGACSRPRRRCRHRNGRARRRGPAVLELARIVVLVRVQLADRRVELPGERGHVRDRERPGGDDDLAGGDPAAARGDEEAVTVRCRIDALDAGAAPDRKRETLGVRREVVAHLAAGRKVERRRGEAEAGQRVPAGRAVEPERVPALAPVIADPLVGVEDQERDAPLLRGDSRPTGPPGRRR